MTQEVLETYSDILYIDAVAHMKLGMGTIFEGYI